MAHFAICTLMLSSSVLLLHLSFAKDTAGNEKRLPRQHPSWPVSLDGQFYPNPWLRFSYPYHPSYFSAALPYFSSINRNAFIEESQGRTPVFGAQSLTNAKWRDGQIESRQNFLTDAVSNVANSQCFDANGLEGRCVPAFFCNLSGGRPEGSCGLGRTCCFQVTSKCGDEVTRNNTYWESLPSLRSDMTCSLSVALDQNRIEQWRTPICQIRLDFLVFHIGQPNADSTCATDSFIVGGATNKVPVICGENPGQHMYLHVNPSTSAVQLLFNFGKSSDLRYWNIKIALLPCGADYLAPPECIQYFTQNTGVVKAYNWKDWPLTRGARQLANQDLRMCFRREQMNIYGQVATKICFSPCTIFGGGRSFSLTGLTGSPNSVVGAANCPNDFLIIPDGSDAVATADRYCGQAFNPLTAGSPTGSTVCTTVENFHILYRTDGTEPATETQNTGFCLNFEQRPF